jgi:hypothetical protein
MMQTIPVFAQSWVASGIVAPASTWLWAATLFVPVLLSGGVLVGAALRELGVLARLRLGATVARARPAALWSILSPPLGTSPQLSSSAPTRRSENPRRGTLTRDVRR